MASFCLPHYLFISMFFYLLDFRYHVACPCFNLNLLTPLLGSSPGYLFCSISFLGFSSSCGSLLSFTHTQNWKIFNNTS
jgi:hypothetical protein